MQAVIALYFVFFLNVLDAASLNLVVFSYNRPLQLYAFLESFTLNTQGCEKISVVYKSSSPEFEEGYNLVKQDFPHVEFLKEAHNSKTSFKLLTLKAINFDKEKHIIFAVDDIIVTRPINFNEISNILDTIPAEGFYLRLGTHITECYSENKITGVPYAQDCSPHMIRWRFEQGHGDWAYPHTVDMTVYRKHELKELFLKMPFNNPNTLEGLWSMHPPLHKTGLCYTHAALVNCPLNRVQRTYNNRHSNECSPEELLELFLNGCKLDIKPLQNILNKAPHMDYTPTFIRR